MANGRFIEGEIVSTVQFRFGRTARRIDKQQRALKSHARPDGIEDFEQSRPRVLVRWAFTAS